MDENEAVASIKEWWESTMKENGGGCKLKLEIIKNPHPTERMTKERKMNIRVFR